MKFLRGMCLVLSKIILVVLVLLFLFSMSFNYALEEGISSLLLGGFSNVQSKEQYGKKIGGSLVEEINNSENLGLGQLKSIDVDEFYNEILSDIGISEEQLIIILESDLTKELINEFVDTVLVDFSTGDVGEFNLGEKVLSFAKENKKEIEALIGQPLPMEKIDSFAHSDEIMQFNEQYKEIVSTVNTSIPKPIKGLVLVIERFISSCFRKICLIFSALLIFLIALLQGSFYKWIRTLGNTIWGCGLFVFIINLICMLFSTSILTMLNINLSLNFFKPIIISIISIGVGVVLVIVYFILKKIFDRHKANLS